MINWGKRIMLWFFVDVDLLLLVFINIVDDYEED